MTSTGVIHSLILAITLARAGTAADLRKAAPDFRLTDARGKSVKLSKYKGRVVLLDFWATWCGGCKVEIPWFMEFASRYKHLGLTVIGVAMDEDGWKSVKPFLREKKLNYPVALGNGDLAKRYGADSLPMTLLIDRKGKIADAHTGLVDKSEFESLIQALLRERPAGADDPK